MSDNEDLDLQALQRQLDDAFETTRPRGGFEDELWSRMQAGRPLSRRVAEFFGGLVGTMREVPAVPAAADRNASLQDSPGRRARFQHRGGRQLRSDSRS